MEPINGIIKTWQNHWDSIPVSNKLRKVKKNCVLMNLPTNAFRREQIILNRSRIGHSHITHSYLITKEPQSSCDILCKTLKLPLRWHTSLWTAPNSQLHVSSSIIQNHLKKPSISITPSSYNIFKFFKQIDYLDEKLNIIIFFIAFL